MVFEASSKIETQVKEQREEAVQTSAQASTVSPSATLPSLNGEDSSSLDEFRGSDVEDNGGRNKIKSKKKAKAKEIKKENSTGTGTQPIAE